MASFKTIKKVFETLFYPARIKKMNLPPAELLSIVIDKEQREKGLATELVQKGLAECAQRGIEKVKVLVAADNQSANKLYKKCGFEFVAQIENHGIFSNVYVVDTAKEYTE
jgi:ribosomal protein S18 acetylase RimI-like enzyme